jgi:hypothetical protein
MYYTVITGADGLDATDWTAIVDAAVTEDVTNGSAYYSVSFDDSATFAVWTGSAWRNIASNSDDVHGGTDGTWYYRDNADTWATAEVSDANRAISQAVAAGSNNQMLKSTLEGLSETNWESSDGFATTDTAFDLAVTLYLPEPDAAMWFDGSNDYVDVGSSSDFDFTSGAFTCVFDFYTPDALAAGRYRILNRGAFNTDGWEIHYYATTETLVIRTHQSGATQNTSSTTLSRGEWHRLCVVRNGASVTIYNAANTDITSSAGTHIDPATASKSLYIGSYTGAPSATFEGVIKNVQIYDAALSEADRATALAYGTASNLIGHWIGGGNQDADWTDQSTNSHDGTVNGSPVEIHADNDAAAFLSGADSPGTDLVRMMPTVADDADGDSWTSPSYTDTISVTADTPLSDYFDQTYRWWRLVISDASNSDGYIEIGEMYLGSYLELSGNADWGSSSELRSVQQEARGEAGQIQQVVYDLQRVFDLSFDVITNDEIDDLETLLEAVFLPSSQQGKPFFFHLFYDEADTLYFVRLASGIPRSYTSVDINSTAITLEECLT